MNTAPMTAIGNLTKDAELRFTTVGNARLTFGIACNRSYKKNDEWVNETSFFDVGAWGTLAEEAARVLGEGKGAKVIVSGRMEQRSYEDKDGNKRYAFELIADTIALDVLGVDSYTRKVKGDGERQMAGAGARSGSNGRAQRPSEPFPADEAW